MLHTGTIPASKTRGPISWTFLESGDRTAIAAGSLTTTEEVGKRSPRLVSSRYDLDEQVPPAGMKGREFLVVKTDHKGDGDTVKGQESVRRVGEVYNCRLFDDGTSTCTCPAGVSERCRPEGSKCVHLLCLKDLVAEGAIPDNLPDQHPARTDTSTGRWGADTPPADWWAEAAGGRLVSLAADW